MQFWKHGQRPSAGVPKLFSWKSDIFRENFCSFELFLRYFCGTRRMQFWQQRRFFWQNSETIMLKARNWKRIQFSLKKQCFFQNAPLEGWNADWTIVVNNLLQRSDCSWLRVRNDSHKVLFFKTSSFSSKCFSGQVRCSFHNTSKKSLPEVQNSKIIILKFR